MSRELKLVKENKKSSVFENDEYVVKISDIDGGFCKRNSDRYVEYDFTKEDDELVFVKAVKLEVTNKKTGKKAQKTCYQGYDALEDFQQDLYNGKMQFRDIFKKIDEK